MNKVIIGIVGKHIKSDKVRTDTLIRDEVKQAIFDNGAIGIGILSPNDEILYTSDDWKNIEENIEKEQIVEQIIRPTGLLDPIVEVRKTKGQIDDLVGEINDRIEKNERVLITTLTIRMAEELTSYLKSLNIKVAYLLGCPVLCS